MLKSITILLFTSWTSAALAFTQSDIISTTQLVDVRLSGLEQPETFFLCTAYNSSGDSLDTTSAYVEGTVDVVSLDFQTKEAIVKVVCEVDLD